ncbi:MAG: MMPL family transporter [Bacteroidetes bacterium]|nr:MMPL family transporter [Bacteroidota bacterium]
MRILADFILAFPRFIIAVIIVLTIGAIFPALNVQTDFNLEGFFPEDSVTIEDYQRLAEDFGRDDNAIGIAFKAHSVFDDQTLLHINSIASRLEQIPNVENVLSIATASRLRSEDGMLISEPYVDFSRDSQYLKPSEQIELKNDPFVSDILINSSGTVTAIYLEVNEQVNQFVVRRQVIADLQSVLSDYQEFYDFNIAGIPFFRNIYVEMLNAEIFVFVSISSVLIIGILWLIFGNIRGILIPILIVWLTILFTVAIVVLTGGYFEIMSSTIAPILLCVGVADSIHLLTKYQDARATGMSSGPALRETIIILGSATLLTSVTTAIGFGTLATSSVVPMQRFGYYTAAGVIIAFLITIFLLPSILPYFKERRNPEIKPTKIHQLTGVLLKHSYEFVISQHKLIVIGTFILTVFFAWGATSLKVNGKIFDDVDDEHPVMIQSQFFSTNLAPQFPLEFVIDTHNPDGVFSPEFLNEVEEFESYLLTFPEIEKTTSLATLIRQINGALTGNSELPESREAIAQYMLLLELSGADGAERLVDFDYSTIRIATNIQDVGSYRVNQIRETIQIWLEDRFLEESVIITGTSILVGDITQKIVSSLTWSIGLAFVLISLLMGWLFKDIKLVLISILPNVIPLLIMAGTMGYLGIDLKPSTAVVFTIAFGIAVDDSIHFLARLRIELSRQSSMAQALSITTQRTGRAILLTSIILMIGFGILVTSEFTSTLLMGALVSQAIVTALLADILFLPAFLHWLNPKLGSRKGFKAEVKEESAPRLFDESVQ